MGLSLDAFAAESVRRGPTCSVSALVASLPPKDASVLTDALSNVSITHAAIARVLKAEGHPIDASTVGRHRKRECACGA